MSYRCQVCGDLVGPNVTMLKNTAYRFREDGFQEISKEISVCETCHEDGSEMSPWLQKKIDEKLGRKSSVQ